MTIREQIEQILKSEKREWWFDDYQQDRNNFATHISKSPMDNFTHVISADYVAKLESLVRLLPGAVEALGHYANWANWKDGGIITEHDLIDLRLIAAGVPSGKLVERVGGKRAREALANIEKAIKPTEGREG